MGGRARTLVVCGPAHRKTFSQALGQKVIEAGMPVAGSPRADRVSCARTGVIPWAKAVAKMCAPSWSS